AGAPELRQEFLLDALGAFRRDELGGLAPEHLLARVAQPVEQRGVDVEVAAVAADQGGHGRRSAEQPLVIEIAPACHARQFTRSFVTKGHEIPVITKFRNGWISYK